MCKHAKMAYNLKISEFSSLEFNPEWKHDFEIDECYIQSFASTDIIRVQLFILKTSTLNISINNLSTNETSIIPFDKIGEQDNYNVYFFELTGLDEGTYTINISNVTNEIIASSTFNILSDDILLDTVLLRYTNVENMFDVIFKDEDDNNYFFEFRIPGGFQYGDVSLKSSAEIFRDQRFALNQLSAYPYKTTPLTIGTKSGVPNWVGEKINLIFSLSNVTIDDKIYVRSEGAEVERIQNIPYYPLYVFKIDIEPSEFYSSSFDFYPTGYRIHTRQFSKQFN